MVESDSSNAVGSMLRSEARPWKFQYHFNDIKDLSSSLQVEYHYTVRSANSLADALPKQGVDRISPWGGLHFVIVGWRCGCEV